jgi:hypothetical protein
VRSRPSATVRAFFGTGRAGKVECEPLANDACERRAVEDGRIVFGEVDVDCVFTIDLPRPSAPTNAIAV